MAAVVDVPPVPAEKDMEKQMPRRQGRTLFAVINQTAQFATIGHTPAAATEVETGQSWPKIRQQKQQQNLINLFPEFAVSRHISAHVQKNIMQ